MMDLKRRRLMIAATVLPAMLIGQAVWAQDKGDVTISHYFTGELGLKALQEQIAQFESRKRLQAERQPGRS